MNAIGNQNYGENSFPSVLFLAYPEKEDKQNMLRPSKYTNPSKKILYAEKAPVFKERTLKQNND